MHNIIFYAATVFSADFTNKYRAKQGENGFLEVFTLKVAVLYGR